MIRLKFTGQMIINFIQAKYQVTTPESDIFHIGYADGEVENLKLDEETWRFFDGHGPVIANGSELTPGINLNSIENQVVENVFRVFGSKEFSLHQAQGLPSFPLQNAYTLEEESFKKFM